MNTAPHPAMHTPPNTSEANQETKDIAQARASIAAGRIVDEAEVDA